MDINKKTGVLTIAISGAEWSNKFMHFRNA